ncbi:MAG TPA: transposase [Thermoanaerobaculia bacterium]
MPDDLLFRNRYRIPSARLVSWDYRWAGGYYVTICTLGRVHWFGEVVDGEVLLSRIGEVIALEWLKIPRSHPRVILDEWIVMPDHLHGILIFRGMPERDSGPLAQSLGSAMGQFKSKATKRIWGDLRQPEFDWQERFHDTILRDQEDLDRVRAYIRDNPRRWSERQQNPTATVRRRR